MPTLSVNSVTITKGKAGVSTVEYNYTVQCTDEECEDDTVFALTSALVGVDPYFNDAIGFGFDPHPYVCPDDCSAQIFNRKFPVATRLVNEDYGKDEVKFTLSITDGNSLPTQADFTVAGQFG